MGDAMRLLSRPLPRQLALLTLLIAVLLLCLGLAYRTFAHADVAVTGDPAATVELMQQLDGLDVDYRLRKDGTLLVDDTDAALLQQAGVPFSEIRKAPQKLAEALSLLSVLFSGAAAFYVAAGLLRRVKSARRTAETIPSETTVRTGEAPRRFVRDPGTVIAARLFEAEHPQTVAVYLLGMPPEEAAGALEAMPAPQRERVWKRMASSGECDAALRGRVAELFSAKMKRLRRQIRPAETTAKMVSIFRLLSAETRGELLALLRRESADDAIIALLEA